MNKVWIQGIYNMINYLQIDWNYVFMHLSADALFCRLLDILKLFIEPYIPLCHPNSTFYKLNLPAVLR